MALEAKKGETLSPSTKPISTTREKDTAKKTTKRRILRKWPKMSVTKMMIRPGRITGTTKTGTGSGRTGTTAAATGAPSQVDGLSDPSIRSKKCALQLAPGAGGMVDTVK